MGADRETRERVLAAVPQQAPFRFIDEILELDETHIVGAYRFREDESFYRGHLKKYETWAAKGVPILYDSTLVNARTDPNFTGYAFTQTASDMGNALSVNILALGTVTAKTGVVKMETLEEMIRKRFKGAAVEMNLKMLAVGRDLAGR